MTARQAGALQVPENSWRCTLNGNESGDFGSPVRSQGSQTTKAHSTRLRLARPKTASVERRSEIPVLALRWGVAIDPAGNLETALAE